MATKRSPLAVTMTVEEWHHVLGVLRAGSRHLEPAAEAIADMFSDAFQKALMDGFSLDEIEALANDR